MTAFQFSPVMTTKTVVIAHMNESKLSRCGLLAPPSAASPSAGCSPRRRSAAELAKNCMPSSEKMYMKRKSSTAKGQMSYVVASVFASSWCIAFHWRASLKMRKSRTARSTLSPLWPPPSATSSSVLGPVKNPAATRARSRRPR